MPPLRAIAVVAHEPSRTATGGQTTSSFSPFTLAYRAMIPARRLSLRGSSTCDLHDGGVVQDAVEHGGG